MFRKFFTLGFYLQLTEERRLRRSDREAFFRYLRLKEMCAVILESVESKRRTEQRPFLFASEMFFYAGHRVKEFAVNSYLHPERNLRIIEHRATGLCPNPYVEIERWDEIEILPPYHLLLNLMQTLSRYRVESVRQLRAATNEELTNLTKQPYEPQGLYA